MKKPLSEAVYKALGADPSQPAPKEQRVCRFALAHGFPPEAVALAAARTDKHQGHKSLDYTLGILRRWDESGVHTVSEITALEPETRAAVGQVAAQPTDSATLAAWEQKWKKAGERLDGRDWRRKPVAYDRKILAAARRALERDRAARAEEMEARRRDVYARAPRIRAIDRELSSTAAAVLKAALESGGDPEAAITQLRDRNLSLQEERASLLGQLGLPADYLADRPLCPKCGDTGYQGSATCDCVKERYTNTAKGTAFYCIADPRSKF